MTSRRANGKSLPRPARSIDQSMVEEVTAALELAHRETLSASDRVRLSRARLAMQGNPLAFRVVPPQPIHANAPTPEFAAKHDVVAASSHVGAGKAKDHLAHRVRPILETYEKHFANSVLLALSRFYEDAESATIVNVTVNYNASGGGTPYNRIGGLGNVQERTRLEYARHQRVVRQLKEIDPQLVEIARWLVTEVRAHDTERMPTVAEAGSRLIPTIKDKATARGIALGSLLTLGWILRHLYRQDKHDHGDEYRRNRDEFEEVDEQ